MNRVIDDLISRKQAIKEILAFCPQETKPGSLDEYGVTVLSGIIEIVLKRLPAASVRHGQWYDKGSLSCRCSCCGCKSNKEYNYCPNCGARMETKNEQIIYTS